MWKTGWIFHHRGIWRWNTIQDTTSSTSNGPVLFICSFLGPLIWRLVVSSQTLSPTFHRENFVADATGYWWRPPVQKPDESLEIKAKAGGTQRRSDNWACRYHQWQSCINQGSIQVNSTGVYRAMYWALYTVQGHARTKLCYCYHPMAKEELGKGLPATNGKRCAYQGRKAEMKRREARHSH